MVFYEQPWPVKWSLRWIKHKALIPNLAVVCSSIDKQGIDMTLCCNLWKLTGGIWPIFCYDKSHINLLYPVDAIIHCGQHWSVLIYSRSGTAVWWHQAIVGIGDELMSIGSERTHLNEFRSLAVLRICIVNCALKSCFKNDIRVY